MVCPWNCTSKAQILDKKNEEKVQSTSLDKFILDSKKKKIQ